MPSQTRAPIPNHGYQRDVFGDAEGGPCAEQKLTLLNVAITVGPRVIQLVGVAHPDQIDRNTAPLFSQIRHDIAPQIRRRRVSMLKKDGIAFAHLDIGHPLAVDLHELLCMLFG